MNARRTLIMWVVGTNPRGRPSAHMRGSWRHGISKMNLGRSLEETDEFARIVEVQNPSRTLTEGKDEH